MPMSPRLLRPIASNLDKDAATYLNAVAVADGQQLEPAVKKAINDFVKGCKQDGIWDAIKASCILAGARTLAGALVPLKGTAPTNNGPFVAGDYNRETGLVGNGSTKFLNSNRNNNADPQDSFHMALYKSQSSSGTATYMGAGALTTETGTSNMGNFNNASFFNRNRCSTATLAIALTSGFMGNSRSIGASYLVRSGGSNTTVTQASQTRHNDAICVFSTTGGEIKSNGRIAFYSIGESLDLSLLDTRVTNLYNAIGAAI